MKHKKIVRGMAMALVVIALFALTPLTAMALAKRHTPSAAYKSSTYYKNLKALPETGNGAFDTLSVALSQYGYHEGGKLADLGGNNRTSTGNYTEYNYALGKVGGTYGYAWCASFVSFCLRQAGEEESAGGLFASCTLWVERLREMGQYRTRDSGYVAQMGDLIFFRSAGVSRASDHVGLVRYVSGGRVYTVEGNSSGQVSFRSYALDDTYIVGYGRPSYQGRGRTADRLAAEDRATGYYVVSYDFLNLRKEPRTGAKKLGALARGEVVRLLEVADGWGRLQVGESVAYASLEYLDFVAPARYRTTYISNGETLLERDFYSTDAPVTSSLLPEREGYRFLYWEGDDGTRYVQSDALPMQDLTLQAVFEPLPPPEPPLADPEEESPPLPPLEETFDTLPPSIDQEQTQVLPSTTAAAQHAGVVSAILSLLLTGLYFGLRRREE